MENKVIVAPLHWGLGHASRCVPIINSLLENNYTPIIASDGDALQFLKQEFPGLESFELPSYRISYHRNLKLNFFFQLPILIKSVQKEHRVIQEFIKKNTGIVGLISDNRFGVRSNLLPSVYITHQLNVLSGITTFFSSFFHQKIIKKFDECWVPDTPNSEFSGKLSSTNKNLNIKFIGVLSRLKKEFIEEEIDLLVLISGPEPNRTLLETKLISELKNTLKKIVFVLGKVQEKQKKWTSGNSTFYNYLLSSQLQTIINSSKMVISRSGYSSVMDLAVLGKKVFFIPTENQPEQEYLATYLKEKGIAPFSKIADFSKEKLFEVQKNKGLAIEKTPFNANLFSLFKCK
tara:strand:+ start:259 stop:1299 length:1041 start_codon:yes stop_codon:yes gene_type:complete